jgi:hypothetical protein
MGTITSLKMTVSYFGEFWVPPAGRVCCAQTNGTGVREKEGQRNQEENKGERPLSIVVHAHGKGSSKTVMRRNVKLAVYFQNASNC